MNIRLLYVGTQEEFPNIAEKARLLANFDAYSDKPCMMETHEDFKQLLSPLASALRENGLTVVLPGKSAYASVKNSLIRALHLKYELSIDVIETLPQDMRAVDKETHAMFPIHSKVFYTKNGGYASFAVRSGNQNLLFLPLAGNFLGMLETEIAPWLDKTISLPKHDGEPYIKEFRYAAQNLLHRNLTVAAAATKTVDFIRTPASISGHAADCVKFSSRTVPSCDCEPQDHTARAAIAAATDCNTVLGMAMSNIFVLKKNGSQQYVVYIAVSCDNNVTVSRVYSGDAEVTEFLKRAACELFSLLNCMIDQHFVRNEIDDFDVF